MNKNSKYTDKKTYSNVSPYLDKPFKKLNISFAKSKEIVQPYLSYYNQDILNKKIQQYITKKYANYNKKNIKNDTLNNIYYKSILDYTSEKNLEEIISCLSDVFNKFTPSHLLHDIFSIYYLPDAIVKITYSKNPLKYNIIQRIYDTTFKIVTEKQLINSYYITESIAEYLLAYFLEAAQNTQNSDSDQGNGPINQLSDDLNNSGSSDASDKYQDVVNNIGNSIDLDNSTLFEKKSSSPNSNKSDSKEGLKQCFENSLFRSEKVKSSLESVNIDHTSFANLDDTNFNFKMIDDILNMDKVLQMSNANIERMFTKMIKKFKKNFSTKHKIVLSPLIDNPDFIDLANIEYFANSMLTRAFIEDIHVKVKKSVGQVDLYIDCSGSMGQFYTGNTGGYLNATNRMALAKGVALRLCRQGYVNDVYFFSDNVSEKISSNDPLKILAFSDGGGTNFNSIIANVNQTLNVSLVITDGEDSVDSYNPDIIWLNITNSSHFANYFTQTDSGSVYVENGKCFSYNGFDINKYTSENKTNHLTPEHDLDDYDYDSE